MVAVGKERQNLHYKWEQHLQNNKDQLEIDTSVGTCRAVIKPRRFKPRKAQSLGNQAKDSSVCLKFRGKPICLEKGIRVCVGLFVEKDCRPLLKWKFSLLYCLCQIDWPNPFINCHGLKSLYSQVTVIVNWILWLLRCVNSSLSGCYASHKFAWFNSIILKPIPCQMILELLCWSTSCYN